MTITPKERALIDQAIAEGRVTKVPPGVSGEPKYIYVDGHLRSTDPEQDRRATGWTRTRRPKGARGRATRDILEARRARVRELHLQGWSGPKIAAELGVNTQTVYNDLTRMGMRPHLAKNNSRGRVR